MFVVKKNRNDKVYNNIFLMNKKKRTVERYEEIGKKFYF